MANVKGEINHQKVPKISILVAVSILLILMIIIIVGVLLSTNIRKDPIVDNWGTYSVPDNGTNEPNLRTGDIDYDFVVFGEDNTFFSYNVFNKKNSTGGEELDYFIIRNGSWEKTSPDHYTISATAVVRDSSYLMLDIKPSSDTIVYDRNSDTWYSISDISHKYNRLPKNSQILQKILVGMSAYHPDDE
ncbi:MAG TPA: hypothetical protein VMS89_07875 [Methanoregulaceae archaeon]|nr:hypothetical protein [Methanoregulaceae archaeon]